MVLDCFSARAYAFRVEVQGLCDVLTAVFATEIKHALFLAWLPLTDVPKKCALNTLDQPLSPSPLICSFFCQKGGKLTLPDELLGDLPEALADRQVIREFGREKLSSYTFKEVNIFRYPSLQDYLLIRKKYG